MEIRHSSFVDSPIRETLDLKPKTGNQQPKPFIPHPLARNPHVQSLLASRKEKPKSRALEIAQEIILRVPVDGETRLQGFYSQQKKSKGLILLLHGWLGSADSSYNRAVADYFYNEGFSVFRLNMRDHGGTEALNTAPFHGMRLEEVFLATQKIAALEGDSPFYIAGFSMGGNFALRLAIEHGKRPIPSLKHVFGVSPSVDPKGTVEAIDTAFPLYSFYFGRKWRKMIRAKQAAFPQLYADFDEVLAIKDSYEMGEWFIPRYSGYPTSDDYYRDYTIHPKNLAAITVPLTIITAQDDPIVPVRDFEAFRTIDNPNFTLAVQPFGGHVGFVDIFPFHRWIGTAITTLIA